MFPNMYLMLRLFLIVWYPCRLSLCEQTNKIKRNLLDNNSNKDVQSKNEKEEKEKHPSRVLSSLSLPVTAVILVGVAFQNSLHVNTLNNQNKETKHIFIWERHENPEIPSPSFSSISNVFWSVLMGRMGCLSVHNFSILGGMNKRHTLRSGSHETLFSGQWLPLKMATIKRWQYKKI